EIGEIQIHDLFCFDKRRHVVIVAQTNDGESLFGKARYGRSHAPDPAGELNSLEPAILAHRAILDIRLNLRAIGVRVEHVAVAKQGSLANELVHILASGKPALVKVPVPAGEVFNTRLHCAGSGQIRIDSPLMPDVVLPVVTDGTPLDDARRVFLVKG